MEFVAMLKKRAVPSLLVDAYLENLDDWQVLQRLEEVGPSVIGISCVTDTRFDAMNLIRKLRAAFPNAMLMAGGYQFSYNSEQALEYLPELDLILRHEAEEAFVSLVDAGFDRNQFDGIKGLTFRAKDGEIVKTDDAPFPHDLDKYPICDWTAVAPEHIKGYGIIATRGCVANCIFCAGAGRKLRFRSPERVLEEIQMLVDIFGHDQVDGKLGFNDDSLTLNRKNLVALMEGMIDNNLRLGFTGRSRADAIDEVLLKLMIEAGMTKIGTGIDAPSQRIMDMMGKRERMDQIEETFRMYSRLKIPSSGGILMGYEGETMEDIKNAVGLFKRLNRLPYVSVGLGLMRIYPGTRLEEIGRENGSILPTFSWYHPEDMDKVVKDVNIAHAWTPWFIPSTISYSKLKWIHFRAVKLTPQYFWQTAKYIVRKKKYGILFQSRTWRVLGDRMVDFVRRKRDEQKARETSDVTPPEAEPRPASPQGPCAE